MIDYTINFLDAPAETMLAELLIIRHRQHCLWQKSNKLNDKVTALQIKWENVIPENEIWQQKEALRADVEGLIVEVKCGIAETKKLDENYEELRSRVNAHYGKEVMKKRNSGIQQMYEEMLGDDDGEAWKRG